MIQDYFDAHYAAIKATRFTDFEVIYSAIEELVNTSHTLHICGNGGSAHTAEHAQTDWSKMLLCNTGNQLRCNVLTLNSGLMTAWSNDYCYEDAFKSSLQMSVRSGDVLLVISGSGNSTNILNVLDFANSKNVTTLGLLGIGGGAAANKCRNALVVASDDMQVVEDAHLSIVHIIMKRLVSEYERL